jgi:hypothetical protein
MDLVYNSDFGIIDTSTIPEEFRPVYPAMEELLEESYCRGDNLVGTSRLVETAEMIEGEPTGRTIYTIAIPITGYLSYEVTRKETASGPDSPTEHTDC